ncbi:hypothetical protein V5799_020968 [Amblyomma americanum]|uniref:Uncharacterized protein n=1 Tax=Amblyomma americanum TaxID=6943 RepID=A0AAQ4FQ36_AMBAM
MSSFVLYVSSIFIVKLKQFQQRSVKRTTKRRSSDTVSPQIVQEDQTSAQPLDEQRWVDLFLCRKSVVLRVFAGVVGSGHFLEKETLHL